MELSHRVKKIKPSPTLAVSARAAELKAEGHDIISLSVGEPDFDTPEHIKEAAIRAVQEGYSKYTAVDGLPSLKQAVIHKLEQDNGLTYTLDQVLVSCGAKHSLFNLFQALLNPGDEVLIPAPYWVSYPDIALLADAQPQIISTNMKQHFKITPQQLEKAIHAKTRLLVLNSPSNPSGMAYSKAELAALGTVLKKHPQVWIVTDDIYEHILWKKPFANILNACPELAERTIVINGVSKGYAMTGWRIGYAAGPTLLIKAMKKIQSQSTSNPTAVAQIAAQAALEGGLACVKKMVVEFKKRHTLLHKRLNQTNGFSCLPSDGTFYSFVEVTEAMKALNLETDVAFAEHLLNEAGVAVVPGSAFGSPGYIRFSFATNENVLNEALDRIQSVIS